ncbi:ribonuclease P/MRP protein subunit RPP20 [Mytilus galloprovincialis]|uniref:Ribonuclease P protein subunit p20 n=1 Tax=Mytilus galloprovincialis TaxID=29158 RepID=A0A8B6H5S8_MYTGA|nr:ribonuclease P/MRP protein subunit RPP20 [Mytilus galloprovincialis]
MISEEEVKPKSKFAEIKDLIDKEEFSLRKRLPRKLPKRTNDVYVSRRTNFKQQLERCHKLMNSGNEVYIHGLGAAINRAVNLALEVKKSSIGNVETETQTSTVELVDDLEPETDEHEPEIFIRNNSAVHIKVFKVTGTSVEPDQIQLP